MKIIFLCSEYPLNNRPCGGFGRYVQHLSQSLSECGHAVSIICRGDVDGYSYHKNIAVYSIMDSYAINRLQKIFWFLPFSFMQFPLRFSLKAAFLLKRICQKDSIDIIEAGDFGAESFFFQLLPIHKKAPLIIKAHTPSEIIRKTNGERKNLFFTILNLLEGYCLKHADAVYAPTKAIREQIQNIYAIKVGPIIPYIYKPEIKKIPHIHRKWKSLLFVGKLQTKKGIFNLLEAAKNSVKKYPDLQLSIVGPDTIENGTSNMIRIQNFIDRNMMQSHVKILGILKHDMLTKTYLQSGAIVVPSLWENFPNVILEAAAHRCPILAAANGGIPEMIQHNKTGLLFNDDQLEAAIECLFENKIAAKKRANECTENFMKHYNASIITKQTLSFYDAVLKLHTVV